MSEIEEIETETIRAALEKRGFAFVEERLKEAGWRSIEGDQYTRRTAVIGLAKRANRVTV